MKPYGYAILPLLALSGCSTPGGHAGVANRPPAAQVTRSEPVNLSGSSEAVWQLRAGLNVAALTCRGKGRGGVAPGYARLLARHKALLAWAHAAEQRRHGKSFDREQTRLYNRFAYQRKPAEFCHNAQLVVSQANALDSPALARAATRFLAQFRT